MDTTLLQHFVDTIVINYGIFYAITIHQYHARLFKFTGLLLDKCYYTNEHMQLNWQKILSRQPCRNCSKVFWLLTRVRSNTIESINH